MSGPNSNRTPLRLLQPKLAALRAKGLTFKQIAAKLDITPQRAHQIHRSLTGPGPDERLRPRLSVATILKWADAHHKQHGRWPITTSGTIEYAPGETWGGVDRALRYGGRGLPGGSSMARLLVQRRGIRNRVHPPPLTVALILQWADAHYRRTGHWPTMKSGAVKDAPGEAWDLIGGSLAKGYRSLPGGTTLARLIKQHRPGARVRIRKRPNR